MSLVRGSAKIKTPGFWPRGLSFEHSPRRSESVVDAGAHEVGGERHVVGHQGAASDAAIQLAEVDVEIFGLGGPVAGDGEFEARTHRPAGIGGVGAGEARGRSADIAERGAAGDEGHEAVGGVTEPAAHGREPMVAGLAAERAEGVGGAVAVGPVDVAFEADDALAELIVVANGAADEAAGGVEAATGRIPLRTAEAAAAVDADVEASPVIDLHGNRSFVI